MLNYRRSIKTFILVTFVTLFLITTNFYTPQAFAAGGKPDKSITKVVAHIISELDFQESFKTVGKIKAKHSKSYYVKEEGRYSFVAKANSHNMMVQQGELLLAIDQDIAESLKSEAQTSFKLAESNYRRDQTLFAKKIISEEGLVKSEAGLEQARKRLATAIRKYENMVIYAPFEGQVGVIKAIEGHRALPGDYILTIIKPGVNLSFIELPEALIGKIKQDSDVFAIVGSSMIPGKVTSISNYITDKGSLNVQVQFDNASRLIHGKFTNFDFIYNKHKNIGIPEKSVLKDNNGNFVYKINDDNKIEKIYVTLGVRHNNFIELLQSENDTTNLKLSDRIVVKGLTKIFSGSEVETKEEKIP